MRSGARGAVPGGADLWLAAAAATALGASGILGLSGTASGSMVELGVAGALAAAGAGLILAAGWVEILPPLLICLPLPALYATEEARLPAVLPLGALVVGAWILGEGRGLEREWERGVPSRGVAVLFGAVAVAALFAGSPGGAARELVNFALLLGLFLVAVDQVSLRPSRAETLARLLAVVAAGAGAAAVLESLGALPGRFPLAGSGLFRATGGFGWPNELGMFLAIAIPFSIHAVRSASGLGGRAVAAAGLALAGLGLAATFSRGSWLAAILSPGVLLLVGERRTALRIWGSGLVAVVAVDLFTGGLLSARVTSTTGDVLVAQRLLLMTAGLLMFQAHPVVGVGPGGFGDALDQFGVQISGLFDYVGSAHNGYIHMAAEAGVLGLAALLYFVGTTLAGLGRGLRPARHADARNLRATFLWSFTAACMVTFFEWPFAHGVGELIVLVAGAGIALAPPEARRA